MNFFVKNLTYVKILCKVIHAREGVDVGLIKRSLSQYICKLVNCRDKLDCPETIQKNSIIVHIKALF